MTYLPAQVHPLDLDPSLIDRRTYATRRRRQLIDVGFVIILTAALAILVPANLVVPQLTGIGRPTLVLGLVLAVGWAASKLHPRLAMRGPQPLRWAAGVYLITLLLAYAAGFLRGLPPLEANAADRAMIATLVFLGTALACADGLANRVRLDDVIRALVWLGTAMAVIGHLQAVLTLDVTTYIDIPGLVDHREDIGFRDRGDGFFQVASTADHYIEFSTVMAMLVPFGIHFARFGPTRLMRQLAGGCALVMAAVVPVTLSRSGFLALVLGLAIVAPAWSWRMRYNMAAIGAAVVAGFVVLQPGLLGTIRSLFLNAAYDPSVQSRTEDYAAAADYLAERPWFGRGPGTFIPSLYRFVDNEWLVHLITVGIVGTAAFAAWHVVAFSLAAIAFRRSTRPEDRHLCACLIAVQIMAAVVAGTFDAMAFSTHTTVLAILTGAAGAMWRFTHPSRQVRSAGIRMTR